MTATQQRPLLTKEAPALPTRRTLHLQHDDGSYHSHHNDQTIRDAASTQYQSTTTSNDDSRRQTKKTTQLPPTTPPTQQLHKHNTANFNYHSHSWTNQVPTTTNYTTTYHLLHCTTTRRPHSTTHAINYQNTTPTTTTLTDHRTAHRTIRPPGPLY